MFRCGFLEIKWVTVALESATNLRDLKRILIHVSALLVNQDPAWNTRLQARTLWSDLDPLLIQLWESHSIRTMISYPPPELEEEGGAAGRAKYLLPESTGRGIVDLDEDR